MISALRASRLLKSTEKLYIYFTVNIFFFSITFCSSPCLFNIFVCVTHLFLMCSIFSSVFMLLTGLWSQFLSSLSHNFNTSPSFSVFFSYVSLMFNSCTSPLNTFSISFFSLDLLSHLSYTTLSLLFSGCLYFLFLVVFPCCLLLINVSSFSSPYRFYIPASSFVSFFWVPLRPSLHNLPPIFSSCLLQISFFTLSLPIFISLYLCGFHYISLYVFLLLSILYVQWYTVQYHFSSLLLTASFFYSVFSLLHV
jgi:hypothetical protein